MRSSIGGAKSNPSTNSEHVRLLIYLFVQCFIRSNWVFKLPFQERAGEAFKIYLSRFIRSNGGGRSVTLTSKSR